jgi:hypothetical protein
VQVFLKQSGENLVLSYLTSAKINEFASLVEATKNAMNNLGQCTVRRGGGGRGSKGNY